MCPVLFLNSMKLISSVLYVHVQSHVRSQLANCWLSCRSSAPAAMSLRCRVTGQRQLPGVKILYSSCSESTQAPVVC